MHVGIYVCRHALERGVRSERRGHEDSNCGARANTTSAIARVNTANGIASTLTAIAQLIVVPHIIRIALATLSE